MSAALCGKIPPKLIKEIKEEVEGQIKKSNLCPQDEAALLHELGSLEGLLDNRPAQLKAWIKALTLDPKNDMIIGSLASITAKNSCEAS